MANYGGIKLTQIILNGMKSLMNGEQRRDFNEIKQKYANVLYGRDEPDEPNIPFDAMYDPYSVDPFTGDPLPNIRNPDMAFLWHVLYHAF